MKFSDALPPHTAQHWWITPKKDTKRSLALKTFYNNPSLTPYRFWNHPTPIISAPWYNDIVTFSKFSSSLINFMISSLVDHYLIYIPSKSYVYSMFILDLTFYRKYAYPKWNFFGDISESMDIEHDLLSLLTHNHFYE